MEKNYLSKQNKRKQQNSKYLNIVTQSFEKEEGGGSGGGGTEMLLMEHFDKDDESPSVDVAKKQQDANLDQMLPQIIKRSPIIKGLPSKLQNQEKKQQPKA